MIGGNFLARLKFGLALTLIGTFSSPAISGIIEEVPTNWRLQNYINTHEVAVWYSGATVCTSGKLGFSGSTADELNRFWSTVLTAKIAGRAVGITFTGTGDSCVINDFWIQN
ncbi:hypothetical protein SAMN05518668_111155 [Sphingobium sp. YR657]|uniref:hypothetical protein n=1 Tax=Sphingobium sp. YR657 TaxID=1884366 RepID=UPI000911BC2F|nr:hypothetical protein [Sphingobium sp. YR657]SHM56405.1 hypothetical protein SAMN05518668_111155 [Sphingobium sp. YR657]